MNENINWSEVAKTKEKTSTEKIVRRAIEKIEKKGKIIGEGKTSKVIFVEKRPNLCLKEISDKGISKNRANKEMQLLDLACNKNIPVPKPLCSLETESGKDYLFMETISGLSLEDLINKDLYDNLPDSFDFKEFFVELRQIVENMHNAKIYHRDLHLGNVMVDKNRKPVIIDFGDAVEHHFSSEDPYRDINPKGELIIYPRDEDKITESYRLVSLYLKEKGYFHRKEASL